MLSSTQLQSHCSAYLALHTFLLRETGEVTAAEATHLLVQLDCSEVVCHMHIKQQHAELLCLAGRQHTTSTSLAAAAGGSITWHACAGAAAVLLEGCSACCCGCFGCKGQHDVRLLPHVQVAPSCAGLCEESGHKSENGL